MSQQQQDDAVMRFCSLTSATPEQARFFLESSAWNFKTAVENFFEDDSGHHFEQGHHQQAAAAAEEEEYEEEEEETPVRQPGPLRGVGPVFGSSAVDEGRTDKPPKDKKASSSRGGVRTLSDLNRRSDSDNEDETQEYYTGGEKSGMLVQDPQRGNRVDAIFEQARRMGAQEGPSEPPSARTPGRSTFTGVGRTLTGEPVQQGDTHAPVAAAPPRQPEPVIRNITFWRNGFTVDNGPLRRLDDPANAQFLMSISKSECPKELEPADRGTPVHVNLVRREEDWTAPPEPRHVPFQGVGRTLGSSSGTESGSTPTGVSARNEPSQGLIIDDSKPVTSIQLRLSDGTRMVARFNNHHTVGDIRRFIDAARPNNSRNYQLQIMGFPPKTLSNTSETIEGAGLTNAVVIQKA